MTYVAALKGCIIVGKRFCLVVLALELFTVFAATFGANRTGLNGSCAAMTFLNLGMLGIILTYSDMYAVAVRGPFTEAVSGSKAGIDHCVLCATEVVTVCGLGAIIGTGSVAVVHVIGEGVLELFAIVHSAILTGLGLSASCYATYVSASEYGVGSAGKLCIAYSTVCNLVHTTVIQAIGGNNVLLYNLTFYVTERGNSNGLTAYFKAARNTVSNVIIFTVGGTGGCHLVLLGSITLVAERC